MGNPGFYGFSKPGQGPSAIYGTDLTSGQNYAASTAYGSSPAPRAFDDSISGDSFAWMSNGVNTNQWIICEFNTPQIISKMTIRNGAPQSANRAVKQCRLEASNDGVTWTKLSAIGWTNGAAPYKGDEISLANDTGTTNMKFQTIYFDNTNLYTYYRVWCYNNYGDSYLAIAEIEMMALASLRVTTQGF